jgi:hypothetical protein
MIGCVSDPLGITRLLLNSLKPGGILLFNAPNLEACWLRGQLWLDGAPPPDLVTLFKPGFWGLFFSDVASVEEKVETCAPELAVRIALNNLRRAWLPPEPRLLEYEYPPSEQETEGPRRNITRLVASLKSSVASTVIALCPRSIVPELATEFGLFVTMTKK